MLLLGGLFLSTGSPNWRNLTPATSGIACLSEQLLLLAHEPVPGQKRSETSLSQPCSGWNKPETGRVQSTSGLHVGLTVDTSSSCIAGI